MKIAVTSDLHGVLPEVQPCDILLICGDLFPLRIQSFTQFCKEWLRTTFTTWCNNIPATNIVIVAGNHDFYFMRNEHPEFDSPKVIYLRDSEVNIQGVRIYGTPWCHEFGNWPFMIEDQKLQEKYSNIPEGLDILITHDAPKINNLGKTIWFGNVEEAGNEILAEAILQKKPKYAFCGHIHDGDHKLQEVDGILMANVSLLDNTYTETYPILYYEYSPN